MPFQIIRNDITKMKTDAIVSPAGCEALVGGGVEGAVYRAAGREELLAERRRLGRLEYGEAAATSAGRLPCRYVFHACSPVFRDGSHGEEQLLKSCYEQCLGLAVKKRCGSIAFPLLSAGSNGYPGDLALTAAVSVFRDFLQTREMEIYLVVFDGEAAALSGKLFSEVRAYVDEHYVEEALRKEYEGEAGSTGRIRAMPSGEPEDDYESDYERPPARSLWVDKKANRGGTAAGESREANRAGTAARGPGESREVNRAGTAARGPGEGRADYGGTALRSRRMDVPASGQEVPCPNASALFAAAAPAAGAAPHDLHDFLHQNNGSFEEYLQQLINRKGMTNADVYKRANLSKQYFSKLMHGQVKPAKEKLLCIAVALKLNLDETADFLRIAGFALSPCSKTDLVFEYFITRCDFDIFNIDIALFDCGLPSLMD